MDGWIITGTLTGTDAESAFVQVRLRDPADQRLPLPDLVALMDGVSYIFELAEARVRSQHIADDLASPIYRTDSKVSVSRINYNSPLELWLEVANLPGWLTFGASVAALVLGTWNGYARVRLKLAEGSVKRAESRKTMAERRKITAEATEIELRNATTQRRLEMHRVTVDYLVEQLKPQPLLIDPQRAINAAKALEKIEELNSIYFRDS